mgnify:CR=1 FL=1
MIEKIDKTIEVLCDAIQKETKTSGCINEIMPDMVKTLAELISARAKLNKKF